jgi:hypothetical protein
MKDLMKIIGIIAGTILIVGAMLYFGRLFSNATTPVTLVQPKPGITCATMVTGDGTAISCWKD